MACRSWRLPQQAGLVTACADHLRMAITDRAVDDPGADRIHPLDFAEVDRDRIGQCVDLALRGPGAGNRQRPRDPVDRAATRRDSSSRCPCSAIRAHLCANARAGKALRRFPDKRVSPRRIATPPSQPRSIIDCRQLLLRMRRRVMPGALPRNGRASRQQRPAERALRCLRPRLPLGLLRRSGAASWTWPGRGRRLFDYGPGDRAQPRALHGAWRSSRSSRCWAWSHGLGVSGRALAPV